MIKYVLFDLDGTILDFYQGERIAFIATINEFSNYELNEKYNIKIHSNCAITINGGKANVLYKEVLRDYAPLIPEDYKNDDETLHFNLWLTKEVILAK